MIHKTIYLFKNNLPYYLVVFSMPIKKKTWPQNHHTVLFKKILSSFFAKEAMVQIGMNPASMFVSFVSSKQFFWLINRRMAEHYKLNLFDISLDSFDVRIGFWDDPTITVKNIDIYYAYNSSANFIGYKSYTPNIIATGLSLLFAAQTVDLFEDEDDIYFNHFIFTIYFLVFVFVAKIKIFPIWDRKQQYDRFVKVFWSFYETIFDNTSTTLDTETYERVKNILIDDVKTLFALFHIFKELSEYFYVINDEYEELLKWLFAWDLQHKVHDKYAKQYLELHANLCQNTNFSTLEKKIIDLIIPADVLIRYLFGDNEGKFISKHILSTLYEPAHFSELMESFIASGDRVKECIEYSIEFASLKKHFFFWLQNYIKAKIQTFKDNKTRTGITETPSEEDIDEFLSFLAEWDQIDVNSLPWNVHIQTITLDRLINFYISFVGGFWVAKWDNGYVRLHKWTLLRTLLTQYPLFGSSTESIQYYARFFTLYEKNVFYYQYIFNHVRSGKDSFVLPTKASIISHESNLFIIQLLNESYRSILLQDTYKNEIKLYIKKPEILEMFKELFWEQITWLIKDQHQNILEYIYRPYDIIGTKTNISDNIIAYITEDEVSIIKDRMYCIDFWIFEQTKEKIIASGILSQHESHVILWLFANMKETLFGYILYMQYIISCEESHQKDYHSNHLISLYCHTILQLHWPAAHTLGQLIKETLQSYKDILALWVLLDDNQDYMYIWFNNRSTRIEEKELFILWDSLTDEDIIWFIGYLKHITYYNRRFLIPH